MPTSRKPERHEYEFVEYGIVHRPTKAKFSHHPGRTDIHMANYGHAGDVLLTGNDYDRDEVREMAQKLFE